jgi:hypothetical protein
MEIVWTRLVIRVTVLKVTARTQNRHVLAEVDDVDVTGCKSHVCYIKRKGGMVTSRYEYMHRIYTPVNIIL